MQIQLYIGVSGCGKTTRIQQTYLNRASMCLYVPGNVDYFPRTLIQVEHESIALAGSYQEMPTRGKLVSGTDCFRRDYGARHIVRYVVDEPDCADLLVMEGYKIYSVQLMKKLRELGVDMRVTHFKCPQHVAYRRLVERGDPPHLHVHEQKYRIAEGFAQWCKDFGLPVTEVATWHQ